MAKHPLPALNPYLRDELAAGERARVASHLARCAECRALSDSLRHVSADLARWIDQMPAPDAFAYRAELARKLATRQPGERCTWRPRLAWVSLLAAGAAAFTLIFMLSISGRPKMPPVEQLATENGLTEASIGLLRAYPIVSHLDLLENYDVIEDLDDLPGADNQKRAT
jgi:anti-sigma factor RsiW